MKTMIYEGLINVVSFSLALFIVVSWCAVKIIVSPWFWLAMLVILVFKGGIP